MLPSKSLNHVDCLRHSHPVAWSHHGSNDEKGQRHCDDNRIEQHSNNHDSYGCNSVGNEVNTNAEIRAITNSIGPEELVRSQSLFPKLSSRGDNTTDVEFQKLATRCGDYRRKCLLFQSQSDRNLCYHDPAFSLENDLVNVIRYLDGVEPPLTLASKTAPKALKGYKDFITAHDDDCDKKLPAKTSSNCSPSSLEDRHGSRRLTQSCCFEGTRNTNSTLQQQQQQQNDKSPMMNDKSGKKKKKILVKGTYHTYKLMMKGETTIVTCPKCAANLQVGNSARLVYCMICKFISPVDKTSTHAANNNDTIICDEHIAKTLQQQEIAMARAREFANGDKVSCLRQSSA